ncbi:hypothetical protein [Comamonas sp. lk]|uniref:hypothetical protein n=1 Tax=Comamonas sp. lk TaxID=2201272 RepID=UPI000EB051F6|nr:hypothetical protein [Comamonas sp. lk]
MNEELKVLQTQLDLISQVLVQLVNASSTGTRIERQACMAALELAKSTDSAVADAAAAWGAKWFPHRPHMDSPFNM